MPKRSMYIWKLRPIIEAEGSVARVVSKARQARISALWVKIADGASEYRNITGSMAARFTELIDRCHAANIEVWGWHVPHCATMQRVQAEVSCIRNISSAFALDGLIMDAEHGSGFFQGGTAEADRYAKGMKAVAATIGKPLAVSSHDIPQNMAGWLPKFNEIAAESDLNFPQVYYGGSPSVEHRLVRAEDGNSHLTVPFCPVGAAWIGDGGGCASATACAERGREFIRLVKEREYQEYSFWHWAGAPSAFWSMLNTTPA